MSGLEEAVRFLRKALRVSRKIPSEVIARKFRFNIREAVELYSFESDPSIVSTRLEQGWKALGTLEKMLNGPPHLVAEIFRPFQFMEAISNRQSMRRPEVNGPSTNHQITQETKLDTN